jgi:hypothetical protein
MKILHLYNIDEYSNRNRVVVPNIQILIFGICPYKVDFTRKYFHFTLV